MIRRGSILLAAMAIVAQAGAQLHGVTYASGFSSPMQMIQDPTQANTQYVVERAGRIRVVQNGTVGGDFLNISGLTTTTGERGLLGLALAPNYAASGKAYVYYTDLSGNIQIKQYTRSTTNSLALDPATAQNVISVSHPGFSNHNGGTIRFGPDGYLYAGFGDEGSGNDPNNNAQNPNQLLGKMIRIDPSVDDFAGDATKNYGIPLTNPFRNGGGPTPSLPEIWAFGYRNPFRFSFDSPSRGGNGGLVVADVGQDAWEEIDYEPAGQGGRNYGWRLREGANNTANGGTPAYLPLTDPIYQYQHPTGFAIIGGYVYRGTALPSLYQGRYFFGDEVSQKIWSVQLTYDANGQATASNLLDHTTEFGGTSGVGTIVSFDQDAAGELYYTNLGGTITRIAGPVPEPASILALSLGLGALVRRRKGTRARPADVASASRR